MEQKLKIAVFIDFDNIEIGVKSTLHREFDVAAVLDALKERGEIVTKFAYANWGRQESATRALSEHAVQMVQRDPSPRGDKNGADINLALDALEMAFTHDHINAFAIVSGDSDFIALVNKLKQYDKRIFVVGGRAFTSTILQRNCHEFVAYESMIDDSRPRTHGPQQERQQEQRPDRQERMDRQDRPPQQQRPPHKRVALDLVQAMPLVERALSVLERREVRPQLGLLKSTMLQLDSTFNEKAYGASSFTDFVERLQKSDYVEVTGGEGRYMIRMKGGATPEKPGAKPEEAIPLLRDVLETHRMDIDNGSFSDELAEWVKQERPNFDWRAYGFQEFSELLNFAQDTSLSPRWKRKKKWTSRSLWCRDSRRPRVKSRCPLCSRSRSAVRVLRANSRATAPKRNAARVRARNRARNLVAFFRQGVRPGGAQGEREDRCTMSNSSSP
jgi:uncharacterized protein (TIGR00288 family)